MTPGLASPRALLPNAPVLLPLTRRLTPSSQNREPRPKSEWCCRRRLLSPQKNEPLSFGTVCAGAAGTGLRRRGAPVVPSRWLGSWVDAEGRQDEASWAAQSQPAACPPAPRGPREGSGVQGPCTGQRGTSPGRAGRHGRGIQPARRPAPEGSPSNKPPPRKKRQKKIKPLP